MLKELLECNFYYFRSLTSGHCLNFLALSIFDKMCCDVSPEIIHGSI